MAPFFDRLKVSRKLMLIGFLFLIPQTVLLWTALFGIDAQLASARLEKAAIEYQTPLEELLQLIPQHLLQAQVGLGSDQKLVQRKIEATLERLAEVDRKIGQSLQFTREGLARQKRDHCTVKNLVAEWQELTTLGANNPEMHLHLMSDARMMIVHAGDSAHLGDSEAEGSSITLRVVPEIQDRLFAVVQYGVSALGDGTISKSERDELAGYAALLPGSGLKQIIPGTRSPLNLDARASQKSLDLQKQVRTALEELQKKAEAFIEVAKGLSGRETPGISAMQFAAVGMQAHSASFELWKAAKEELNLRLDQRTEFYLLRRARCLILAALAFIGIVGFVTLTLRSISSALRAQVRELRRSNETLQQEINDRRETEAALKNTEECYRRIFEHCPQGIFQTTEDGRFQRANPALARMLGYDSPEELQLSMTDIAGRLYVAPGKRAEFRRQIAERGQLLGFESEVFHKNGSKLWISESARAVHDTDGKFLYYEGIVENVTVRKRNESALQKAQADLVQAARTAAMTEASTGLLQSIGAVLKSVNTTATSISDALRKSRIPQLSKVAGLIRENEEVLLDYITNDPKGRLLPRRILDLSTHLATEHAGLLQKMEQLKTHLDHAKQIVALQQNSHQTAGVKEMVSLSEVVEDAIRLTGGSLSRHKIEVVREYDPGATAHLDKHKVLQVLVNLVRNAEHSCAQSVKDRKQVTLRVATEGDRIKISVADNGVGIAKEDIVQLFKQGFTTKKDGHGFGLHNCAATVKELGGTIQAHSDGEGLGAIFTLELPIQG